MVSNAPSKPSLTQNADLNPIIGAIATLIFAAGSFWFLFGGGLEQQTENTLQNIREQVADDLVEQYEIAKRSGDAMDACVHAGIVAAAFLQAKDERNYQKWKEIEKRERQRAGLQNP